MRASSRRSALAAAWSPAVALAVGAALALAARLHPGALPGEVGCVRALQRVGEPVPTLADAVWLLTGTEAALVVGAVAAPWLVARCTVRGVVAIAIAAATMLVAQPGLKQLVDRPRPPAELVDVRTEPQSTSFPSGHTMSTTTVWGSAVGLASIARRRAVALAGAAPIVLALLASAVLGAHWPSDAIGGLLFGAAAAWLVVAAVTRSGDTRPGEPA